MPTKKKLIEVALPLEAINAESAREKSIRHGHPSTLHLWWARRPLAAARAVIWASLVDDPSSLPDQFPTEEAQNAERERLFNILSRLVKWENSNNQEVLDAAKAEIMKSTDGNPPALLDPFAGGGAIPLEAQRLGLEAHASDLNPVAVMINKAMIEIPPKFAGQKPVNPEAKRRTDYNREWRGASGLAEDVRYYGEWMKQKAFERIGHLYPKVKDERGREHTVIAWIWARTVKCPNPACGCEMPLASSFELSKKKGKEVYIQPVIEDCRGSGRSGGRSENGFGSEDGSGMGSGRGSGSGNGLGSGNGFGNGSGRGSGSGRDIGIGGGIGNRSGRGTSPYWVRYEVKYGKNAPEPPKMARGAKFKCVCCDEATTPDYIKTEALAGRMSAVLMAIVAEGNNGRLYFSPNEQHSGIAKVDKPADYPDGDMPQNPRWFSPPDYGIPNYAGLFTNRQLTALTTFSDLVSEAQEQIVADGGNKEYAQAVGVYLAFSIDKGANLWSTICSWMNDRGAFRETFARQAIPMVWDYAEANPFSNSGGNISLFIERCADTISFFTPNIIPGMVRQSDAQSDIGMREIMVSTDPPYYDNIGYADLLDYFYVWMRKTLKNSYPELFKTMLVPKKEELVATPYRFEGNTEKARKFFEKGMLQTFKLINIYSCENVPVTIYYAFKQSDSDEDNDGGNQIASIGWETMLSAVVSANFAITGTWPIRTESPGRSIAQGTNALASSIVLVCRKRPADAPFCTRRDFVNALKRELKPALQKLQTSNIAPVDMAQSAIGPGIGVYSRFSKVLEADGTPMSVRAALQIINQELDLYFTEQDGELDRDSRFCVDLYTQYAFNDLKFGEADVLARAKNTSVDKLAGRGVLCAQKGIVRLLTREEIPEWDAKNIGVGAAPSPLHLLEIIWLFTQQLTRALEKDGVVGVAKIISDILTSEPEHAKALAYRLFTIAERKGWTQEAFAYNSLVIAWPEIQSKAAELQSQRKSAKQGGLF